MHLSNYLVSQHKIHIFCKYIALCTGSPSPFHRPDLFAFPTAAELRLGWQNLGGVRLVNCLNPNQTAFPRLSKSDLLQLGGGPYLLKLAISYLTSYRLKVAQRQPYVNINAYHASRRQRNMYMLGQCQIYDVS